jgi:hypothetical protein
MIKLLLIMNRGVNHRGYVGHQECAGETIRSAHQGGGSSRFEISEADFESNSESRTTSP